jgi:hypothetical protein
MTQYLDPKFNSLLMGKQVYYDNMPTTTPQEVVDKISALFMEVRLAEENLLPMGFISSCGVLVSERLKVLNQSIADLEHLWKLMNKKFRR